MSELFCSFDIEADGPCPGINSMISIGAVIYNQDGAELRAFYANLKPLPGAVQDPDTMRFWGKNPEAWAQTQTSPQNPDEVLRNLCGMVRAAHHEYNAPCALVAYPAGFDFSFLYYYLRRFEFNLRTIGFNCLDVRSFVMGATGRPFIETSQGYWPDRWRSSLPHTHNALDDAREQGESFIKILKEVRR